MTQEPLLFDAPLIPVKGVDTTESPRLSQQCSGILKRLREGNATNRELSILSLKYTGRISDLRAAGFNIQVVSRDRCSGLTVYQLKGEG